MLNTVILSGRPTTEIELKSTSGGDHFTSFSLAVEDGPKDKRVTYFFDIAAWNRQAELLAQYVHKGDLIAVRGRLVQRKWTAQDGTNRYAVEVRAEEVQFLSRKNGGSAPADPAAAPAVPAAAPAISAAPAQAPAPSPVQQMPVETYRSPAPAPQFSALTPDEDLPF